MSTPLPPGSPRTDDLRSQGEPVTVGSGSALASKKRMPTWAKVLLALGMLFVGATSTIIILWFCWLKPMVAQITEPQTPQLARERASAFLTLKPNSLYQVFQVVDLFGIRLVRFQRSDTLQQFILLTGLDDKASADFYHKTLTSQQLQPLIQQASRQMGRQRTIHIQSLNISQESQWQAAQPPVPYKTLQMTLQLDGVAEPIPFTAEVGLQHLASNQNILFLSFFHTQGYQPELVVPFIQSIRLK
ncbi:MAG: hypothetical protein SFZ03_00260 [Candidatus Melainabacteria bacterium]|nr:hypothetical protein [Candidatus Melainabacteria bacterium]